MLSALGTSATIVSETKAGNAVLKQEIYLILLEKVSFSLLVVSRVEKLYLSSNSIMSCCKFWGFFPLPMQ
jgi:hypothetical protein